MNKKCKKCYFLMRRWILRNQLTKKIKTLLGEAAPDHFKLILVLLQHSF